MTLGDDQVGDRIVTDPAVLGGKPIVRGTRVAVYLIRDWVESGHTAEEIAEDYPDLTVENVEAAVAYDETDPQATSVRSQTGL